ncbi:Phosphatidylinositol:ceramide inositolphosphotransferase [Actinidia chinensis var. chinensis]|uniref:Phosphatidylinositol:ceramide inositolphosphotransferase n=1 Tax=Actinidia chinensis var. chinensis TaxID=1590841 RepID=A0A2R6RX57_ACTCC|nr:Phosphatidylinositol:ceramide inositolphosphotransferase [Actinidia chinensis var. chinensis]
MVSEPDLCSEMCGPLCAHASSQSVSRSAFIKQCAWFIVVIQGLLIVASHKHYTIDVIVARYTVNLVVFFIDRKLPELPDRTSAAVFLLPLRKDIRTKDKNHKLLNGNSGDPLHRRVRTPLNSKILEDGNTVHVDAATTGV